MGLDCVPCTGQTLTDCAAPVPGSAAQVLASDWSCSQPSRIPIGWRGAGRAQGREELRHQDQDNYLCYDHDHGDQELADADHRPQPLLLFPLPDQ